MSIHGDALTADVAAEARTLVSGLMTRPWGDASPSVYETGRLAALAPWLTGHAERIAFLVGTQRPDGLWGPHEDYALVPTLSAADALLGELVRTSPACSPAVAEAAGRALRALGLRARRGFGAPLPDMPAIELVVPALVTSVNRLVRALAGSSVPGAWESCPLLPFPEDMDDARVRLVRERLRQGAPLPVKLMHALEVAGEAAVRAPAVVVTPEGTVGASPAATAAWLGEPGGPGRSAPLAHEHLEAVVRLSGGPVPCAVPITVFERGWVVSWLLRAGIPVDVPVELVASLGERIDPDGVAAGPGLPADADTTSVALYALALLGAPREPGSLWAYHTGTHFSTWLGEDGHSTTVNAHVLDAFGQFTAARPDARPRYAEAVRRLAAWLCARQRADGSWTDRWHVSPYYATACCALALGEFGGAASRRPVRLAADWVLSSQRPDGSWGLWDGTPEETAYALYQLLLAGGGTTGSARSRRLSAAIERGQEYLLRSAGRVEDPPMWVDKDLYLPVAIVRAVVMGALHLARSVTTLEH
ncbi:prenyltransferase/squalene oxidase repeat-containing protein [Sphaerisporangium sp. NPDC051017]|uniref:prenyltransferase/squalene oxidase repeat-containing protein n=1 Tax=Sphaerisporangium sp. NPDC051017 TaxID=3154636 RepID=UPI003445040C